MIYQIFIMQFDPGSIYFTFFDSYLALAYFSDIAGR